MLCFVQTAFVECVCTVTHHEKWNEFLLLTVLYDIACSCHNAVHVAVFCDYTEKCVVINEVYWNNQQMQLYAVNFIPLLNSVYMFRAAHTPIIRSTTVSTATGTIIGCRRLSRLLVSEGARHWLVDPLRAVYWSVCPHVEWIKQRNKNHCIQLHLLVISIEYYAARNNEYKIMQSVQMWHCVSW